VAAALRFWDLGSASLLSDESYYWLWSERLAASYYDNPAGVAVMVRASTALGGQGEAGVRWLNAALGVGAVYLLYALGLQLSSRRAGLIGAACLAVGAPYLVISRFVYTDALQIFMLLLNLVLLAPLVVNKGPSRPQQGTRSGESWRFWAIGLSMAALLNSKYNAYLYAVALLVLLLVRRRGLFSDRRTWLAMGIAACGLLPVLAWNARHDWASFRWQIQHFGTGTLFRSPGWTKVLHAVVYLTPPLALLGMLGVTQVRTLKRQVLLVPALALTVPILVGPADSPRNLLTGSAVLLLLASDALDRWIAVWPKMAWGVLGVLLLLSSVYGVGTVVETWRSTPLPSSSAARAVRIEGAGWRAVGPELVSAAQVFALDYSIASQAAFYSGRLVHTAWGQYQVWGIPPICGPGAPEGGIQILALEYLDPQFVSRRLGETFGQVQGPIALAMGGGKVLYTWTAYDCRVDQETFLERFDFMTLLEAGGGA
jgi:4-amino-4-deoxy-L-arabinose transferase-like glycosyltransferase